MIITKVTKFRQIKNWSFFYNFIIVIIINLNNALSYEIDFFDIAFIADHNSSWSIKSTKHVNDKLISKASFTLIKEMIERFFKFLEHSRVLYQFGLHFGSDLLVERKFLNY